MNKGFTLIELMIVVAIIAIIAAIAIPNLLESKKAANEASAISALRNFSSCQAQYATRFGAYGGLSDLANKNLIDTVLAGATSTSSTKSGYYYTMWTSTNVWCCKALPGATTSGDRSFRIATDGVIYYEVGTTMADTGGTVIQ